MPAKYMVQANTALPPDDLRWLEGQAKRLGVTRSAVVRLAIKFFREHAPVPTSPTLPEPKPDPAPAPEPAPEPKETTVPPRKRANQSMTRPLTKPVLNDRAECPVCGKQVGVDPETSLLIDHIAHPSVRPRGVYAACDGSGQEPAGPVVHAAETDWRRI